MKKHGIGKGCRAVVVAMITLEKHGDVKLRHRMSKLNSVMYTPKLHWQGIDIKQQVPEFLPMNLWPGTFTLCIDGNILTEKVFSSEEWLNLESGLEKHLQKIPVEKPKSGGTSACRLTSVEEVSEKIKANIHDRLGDNDWDQSSLDAGYVSHKQSYTHDVPFNSPMRRRLSHPRESDSEEARQNRKKSKKSETRTRTRSHSSSDNTAPGRQRSLSNEENLLIEKKPAKESAPPYAGLNYLESDKV
ncbi:hypothetical protein MAR_035131, partial [Mya arenaria]